MPGLRLYEVINIVNNERHYCVYCHVFPNKKKYIGLTGRDPLERWGLYGEGYLHQEKMRNAILYYGWNNIKHYILRRNLTQNEAIKLEKEMIAKYNTTDPQYGYNTSEGELKTEVICLNTGKIYKNAVEAAKAYEGITTRKDIRACCKGKISYAGIDPKTNEELKWMKYYDYEVNGAAN